MPKSVHLLDPELVPEVTLCCKKALNNIPMEDGVTNEVARTNCPELGGRLQSDYPRTKWPTLEVGDHVFAYGREFVVEEVVILRNQPATINLLALEEYLEENKDAK